MKLLDGQTFFTNEMDMNMHINLFHFVMCVGNPLLEESQRFTHTVQNENQFTSRICLYTCEMSEVK